MSSLVAWLPMAAVSDGHSCPPSSTTGGNLAIHWPASYTSLNCRAGGDDVEITHVDYSIDVAAIMTLSQ